MSGKYDVGGLHIYSFQYVDGFNVGITVGDVSVERWSNVVDKNLEFVRWWIAGQGVQKILECRKPMNPLMKSCVQGAIRAIRAK